MAQLRTQADRRPPALGVSLLGLEEQGAAWPGTPGLEDGVGDIKDPGI